MFQRICFALYVDPCSSVWSKLSSFILSCCRLLELHRRTWTWSTPLMSPVATIPVSIHSQSAGSSSPLGKHTREGDVLTSSNTPMGEAGKQTDNQERGGILIPKTLRIHDPEEAAKSSIWSLIGARNSKANAVGGGLFNAVQPKDTENHVRDTSAILHVNPAALSRSQLPGELLEDHLEERTVQWCTCRPNFVQ